MQRSGRLGGWARRTWVTYEQGDDQAGERRPLVGYGVLLGVYGSYVTAGALLVRRRVRSGGRLPERPSLADVALLSVATFRMSRTLAKDAVAAPLRAPFATYQGPAGPGEVMEAPRPGHVRHAVGELVTCPFCLAQWVATAGVLGTLLAPRTTRWVAAGLSAVAAADALHFGFAKLQDSGK